MTTFKTLPLEDCMAAIIDYRGKSPTKTAFGIPLVTAKIIKGGRIEPAEEFIAEADYENWMSRGLPREGDVVLTTEAPLGEVAQLDGSKVALAQRVITLRGRPGLMDQNFLRYLLQSEPVQSELRSRATGTTVLGIRQSELRKVPLSFPEFEQQVATGALLRSIDDKIELNRRVVQTLEAIAQAIFKSWFLDSDHDWPIDDWQSLPLDSVAEFLNGLALQKYPAAEGEESMPVIKIAQLRAGHTKAADRANLSVPEPYVINDGDLLFSWSGSLEVDFWCGGKGALNQHLFKVTSSVVPDWYAYLWTKHHLPEFRAIAANKATTMGHIQRKHLTAAQVLLPSPPILEAMRTVMKPIFSELIRCRLEARTLAELRDELLPRLMSGELTPELEMVAP